MFTHSIRWRFQFWLAFLLLCILSGFGFTAYQLHRTNQLRQTDQELERRVAAIGRALRESRPFGQRPRRPSFEGEFVSPWDPGRPNSLTLSNAPEVRPPPRSVVLPQQILNLFDESDPNGFYFLVWSPSHERILQSTNAPANVPIPAFQDIGTQISTRMRGAFRERFYFNTPKECILVGQSIRADLAGLRRFALWLAIAGAAVLALGLGGGWWLTSRALQPVDEISVAAARISGGNLSERINVADTDSELGRLAVVLNSTFSRLEASFARQKQFTADASHELRTPLAVIISEAQTTLARQREPAEYRESFEACLNTAQQMRRLTESLLELARSDAGAERLEYQNVDLADLARESVEGIRRLAAEHQLAVHCQLDPAPVYANADRVIQVITNLLTNAIHYNKTHGEIKIATRAENGHAILTVQDTGQGIAPEDLPHVFERFYRADKSRARSSERSGLGLAISKAIVEADGGAIEVSSHVGVGTQFTVRFKGKESR